MRDKHYTIKPIRMDDKLWAELRYLKQVSGKTWNLFIKDLIKAYVKRQGEDI